MHICIGTAVVGYLNALSGSAGYIIRGLVDSHRYSACYRLNNCSAAGHKIEYKDQRRKLRKIFAIALILSSNRFIEEIKACRCIFLHRTKDNTMSTEHTTNILGIDENGLGPLMGPLVVTGVLLKQISEKHWLDDISDSKQFFSRTAEKFSKLETVAASLFYLKEGREPTSPAEILYNFVKILSACQA